MNLVKIALVFCLCATPVSLMALANNTQKSALNETQFKQAMDAAIEKQTKTVNDLKNIVLNLNAPVVPGADKQLVDATVMLEVKRNLYSKFIDNSINKDPQFQTFLLQLMNQPTLTEDDLNALQSAVTAAHAREK